MNDRKTVKQRLETFKVFECFDGKNIQEVIQYLNELQNRHEDDDISFSTVCYGYDGAFDIEVYKTRLENDIEYRARVEKELQQKEKEEKLKSKELEKERKEYERLKRKFENK